jgi:hypothetical protein
MNVQRLLNTKLGRACISILLGLGLATLFHSTCSDKNCMIFNGPIIREFDDKIYKYDGKCYKYSTSASKCDTKTKKVLDITTEDNIEGAPPTSGGLSFLGNND